jgi:hypothetical protein
MVVVACLLLAGCRSKTPSGSRGRPPVVERFGRSSTKVGPLVDVRVDYADFLGRNDLVWDGLPSRWHEGAFVGNGIVGSMIYTGVRGLGWDVGRTDVTDRGSRLAIGRFTLVTQGDITGGAMRLKLWDAEAAGIVKTTRGEIRYRSFSHATEPFTVVELRPSAGEASCGFEYEGQPAIPARAVYKKETIEESVRNPDPEKGRAGGFDYVLQRFKAGGGYTVVWGEKEQAGGARAFFFTVDVAHERAPTENAAIGLLRRAIDRPLMGHEHVHRTWWHEHWRSSFVSFPDARLQSFYWIQLYKLASATRRGLPAIDLMGPWFRTTPWPKIWWNLNIQLTYAPVYASNRLEIGRTLTDMIDAGRDALAQNVPEAHRSDSAAIGRTSSYDCRGRVGTERGNLLWALHNYWLQYRYSADEPMLRERLYPLLKRAVTYYLHILEPDVGGALHVPESISPEYPDKARDTNYDLALLRWGLTTLLAAREHLNVAESDEERWRATLERLAPYPVDEKTGYMIGASVPFAKSHRHYSHLLMIYPLHLVDPENAADRPLIEKSLAHWIGFEGALQGYSFTGSAAMYAWLGDGDRAAELMDALLARYVKPNTMYLEAGPVIETPLSGAATLNEMLMQSWSMDPFGTHIRVFPAVPSSWRDVTIHDMRAEGGFLVSAVRRGGVTRFVRVKSLAGNPCRIRTSLSGTVGSLGRRSFRASSGRDANGNRITTVDLQKGEEVVLFALDDPPLDDEFVIEPVEASTGRENWFGSQKGALVVQDDAGELVLRAGDAFLHGEKIFYEKSKTLDNIGHWVDPADSVSWRARVTRPGTFSVSVEFASTGAGVKLHVIIERKVRRGYVRVGYPKPFLRSPTGAWDAFEQFEIGQVALPAEGEYRVTVKSADDLPPLINLRAVRFSPVVR